MSVMAFCAATPRIWERPKDVAAWMMVAAPAFAQDDTAAEDEVIVTARRTEERLQDVPASVSAFSEAQMERIGALDSTGLQGAVPNLNIVQGRGSSNATNIYIRGVGQPDAPQLSDEIPQEDELLLGARIRGGALVGLRVVPDVPQEPLEDA